VIGFRRHQLSLSLGASPDLEERRVLENTRVLIVEDEQMIAMMIADLVAVAGGSVLGPVPTVAEAMALIDVEQVDAAILDGNLADRDVTPVALRLLLNDVPTIVYSGKGLPDELATCHPDMHVILKPTSAAVVVGWLGQLVKRGREQ